MLVVKINFTASLYIVSAFVFEYPTDYKYTLSMTKLRDRTLYCSEIIQSMFLFNVFRFNNGCIVKWLQ